MQRSKEKSLPVDTIKQSSVTSEVIKASRLPLALMVVFIHSFGEPKEIDTISMDYWHLSFFDVYNLIRVAITQVITHCAVPIFYIISGYLFFQRLQDWDTTIWKQKMKNRTKTVGIPYFAWITIMIVITIATLTAGCLLHDKPWSRIIDWFSTNGWWHLYWDSHVWNLDRLNLIGLPMPASAPILVPFWFMRDLIIVLAITPIIYWGIKKLKRMLVLLLIASYVTGVWIPLSAPCVDAVLFFSIGGYIAIEKQDLVFWMSKFKMISYIFSVVLFPFMIYYNGHNTDVGNILYPFYVLAMCGALLNVVVTLERRFDLLLLKKYSDTTFFIFASHIFLLTYVRSVLHLVTSRAGVLGDLIEYLITPIMTVAICIVICRIIQRRMPRLAMVLGCR
ncbi:MAG: acyltransferase [Bacteroidaceae bacterium]|nr:acyltransferase [Bacteroidaceae bacterium]